MVEADLRFMVLVVVRTLLFAVRSKTVRGVVTAAVHTLRHVLSDFVPPLQGESSVGAARTGPVPLRCTEGGQTQLMVLVDSFGDIGEIGIAFKSRSLDISVTPGAGSHDGDRPPFDHTGGNGESHFVIPVVAEGIRERTAFLGVNAAGDDIDGTAYRGSGQLGRTHTALRLHHRGHVAQSLPVAPIDRTALHVIHRHTVDHRGYVRVIETAHPDLRVAPAATLSVGVHTRRVLEHLGELLSCQTLLDLNSRHLTHCYRGNLRASHLTGDGHVLQSYRFRLHANDTQVTFLGGQLLGLVTDIREL